MYSVSNTISGVIMVIMIISFRGKTTTDWDSTEFYFRYSVIKNLAPITIYDTFKYAASDLS